MDEQMLAPVNNKVMVPNPKYSALRIATVVLFVFALLLAAIMIVLGVMKGKNLNGDVEEVSGTVSFVGEKSDALIIELDGSKSYAASPVRSEMDDWGALQGKNVTLLLPKEQMSAEYRWVLGVREGENVLVDHTETLQRMRSENKVAMIAFGVIMGVLVISSGAVYAFQKKTDAAVEKDLYVGYCEYCLMRQPCCPLYRKLWAFTLGYVLTLALSWTAWEIIEELVSNTTVQAVAIWLLSLLAAAATTMYFVLYFYILPKKERKFYAENYPFDLSDVSHVAIRKKYRQQLQQELTEERQKYPHRYGDGGNGYTVEFGQDGVSLYLDEETAPAANEVFGEGGTTPNGMTHVCDIDYPTLDFEAVPYYRKRDRSLFVVVKSRLKNFGDGDDEHVPINDLHFLLDTNLLATLRQMNVSVDGLDYILENKAQLIEQNCKNGH